MTSYLYDAEPGQEASPSVISVRVLRVDATAARRVKAIFGWIYGDLGPNGHGYFLVPIPATGVSYRVTVQSFDVVSGGT